MLIPANLKARQVEMQLGKGYEAGAKRIQAKLEPVVTSGQQTELNLGKKENLSCTWHILEYDKQDDLTCL